MNKKTVRDIVVKGKKVLLRTDLNVPLNWKTNTVADDTRILAVLPTIEYLINNGARVILCSHLGRPKGNVVEELRLAPVGQRLSELLGRTVKTLDGCIGTRVEDTISNLNKGEIVLLENLRFHSGEEENNPDFARALARLADIFVDDAFGTAHRSHASNVGITAYLPAVAGFLIERELDIMGKALDEPARPLLALIGGAKVSDKMKLLKNIMERVDTLLIGGGMACTFLKAQGYEVGQSSIEEGGVELAGSLLEKTTDNNVNLVLPVDVVIADSISEEATTQVTPMDKAKLNWHIVDIGPQTIELFSAELRQCRTVIWNGPMGIFEFPKFSNGTQEMAKLLASINAITIVCGGSTAEAVQEMDLASKISHVSTGGGAALKFLEGEALPGIEALLDR